MLVGLILAAGESVRMKTAKALLKIGKETFAACVARKMRDAGVTYIILVSGKHHEEIKKETRDVEIVNNAHYAQGQFSSLKEGIRNLPTGASSVLVWPVDLPLVKMETVRQLIDSQAKNHKRLTIPFHDSQRGHPVIYDRQVIHTVLSLSSKKHTAKDLISLYESETDLVAVNDPGVLIDIDTPEDYDKYVSEKSQNSNHK